MKKTPFTDIHIKMGAKMHPFAGFNMPLEYSGINDEHRTVRESAGVFDVSHMGEFRVQGPNAAEYIQYLTTNDITRLSDGMIQYTCFPNGKGGIVDDLLVYRFEENSYMLVVNAANIDKDWNWCAQHAERYGIDVGKDLYNISGQIAQVAVQGPLALKVIKKLINEPFENFKFNTFKSIELAGLKDAVFSVTGYTGSGGCEIYVPNKDGPALWEAVFEAGRDYGIKPAGLGARDTLRLEMGYCLYGNDIDETTSPIEAGLGWITRFVDHNNFIDKEFLLRQKNDGFEKKLVGFVLKEKGIPRRDYEIADNAGNLIGRVTSGTMSPMMNKGIGMGYVQTGFSGQGTEINIMIRKKRLKAEIVKFPIYKP